MFRWLLVAGLTAAAGLTACGGPPPPPPTIVNLTLTAAADVNPTVDGQAAPIAVRVYQLASSSNFNAAEFFPLYNSDAATLKTDLIHREDFLLSPGQSKSETIKPDAPVKALAVFAAYRDFQHATWRGAVDIDANKTTNVTVSVGRDGVTVTAR